MRHFHLRLFATLAMVAALPLAFCSAIASAATRVIDYLLDLWPSGGDLYLRTDFATGQLVPTLAGIDPALYQANRHEAGVARYAADRHI